MSNDDRTRAKQIILEIVRQSGGAFKSKMDLHKTFYHAHLWYAETQPGYLSAWPIVRMPYGPEIDQCSILLSELLAERKTTTQERLPPDAIQAVAHGVRRARQQHETTRAWQIAEDGEELNIYLDNLSEEDYQERMQRVETIASALDDVWAT